MRWFQLMALGSCVGFYTLSLMINLTLPYKKKKEKVDPSRSLAERTTPSVPIPVEELHEREAAPPALSASDPTIPEGSGLQRETLGSTDREPVVPIAQKESAKSAEPDLDQMVVDTSAPDAPEPKESDEDLLAIAASTTVDVDSRPDRPRRKQWFLIKASTGAIRVCEAWERTPKTIAGPFPSKEAALKAKQL